MTELFVIDLQDLQIRTISSEYPLYFPTYVTGNMSGIEARIKLTQYDNYDVAKRDLILYIDEKIKNLQTIKDNL
jgi:hypothetical protein